MITKGYHPKGHGRTLKNALNIFLYHTFEAKTKVNDTTTNTRERSAL